MRTQSRPVRTQARPVRTLAGRLALASMLLATIANAAAPPRHVSVRLFHASAPAIEAAGIPLSALISAGDPRSWDVRVLPKDEWRGLVARLAASKTVHEIAVPGAEGGIDVTRETPWQLDGSVRLAVSDGAAKGSSVSMVELPLRLACWLESEKADAPLHVEALVPTGHASAAAAIPLATRVEFEVGTAPVVAVAVTCEGEACEVNVLAIAPAAD